MVNRIKELREKAGMTQDRLSELSGVSRPFLSCIETGKATPSIDKARALAGALGESLDTVFGGLETSSEAVL